MARARGRPVRPVPVHPERVLSRAIKAGLSATIRLQRAIYNKTTKKYYDRSCERWRVRQQVYQITKEQGSPDFSYISKAEANIRDDTRLMLYEQAAKYGFTEVSRQKNTYDTVEPLNQRINACGVVVRENSEIMFPLPDPVDFGTYTRRDEKARKKYRNAGYEGSSFGPQVTLAHPDLPSLDFGDAARTHNEYLATFCAIHDVPVRETTRYSNLFFLLVRPYLEHLYSEFRCGKANFQRGVNSALRQVKRLILDAGYRPTIHEKRIVTRDPEFYNRKNKKKDKSFFKVQETKAREFYGDHPAIVEIIRLRGTLGDDEEKRSSKEGPTEDIDSIFSAKDVEYIRDEAARRTRVAGSIMHKRLSDLFPSPWHMIDVILSGDRYTRSSDYVIISEVPIQTKHGTGKIDLILCKRTISNDGKQVFWKPVFVLEIKTRLGQSWYFEADYKESEVRPEGSPLQRVVPAFPLSDFSLSDKMWDAIVRSTPTSLAKKQMNIYSQALIELYENITKQDLGHILRGVVVIESSSDINEIREILEQLIIHAYESAKSRVRRLRRTVYTPSESASCRVALVLDEQPGPGRGDGEQLSVPWTPTYTPFKTGKKMKGEFLLYLSGHSPTSAGRSAAWNAQYYHGLQMLYDMKKTRNKANYVWIDLADQFTEPRLAEARLRLRPRGYSTKETAKVQPDHIRQFFERVKVKGYLNDILKYLYENGKLPSFALSTRRNERKVIIITGADTIRDATPTSHQEKLTILIDHLLSSLPDREDTTIVWFDSPVPSVEKATPYSCRALIPFHETSSLRGLVTEIVWNLPIAPRSVLQPEKWALPTIGDSPMYDDIRVIVCHRPDDLQVELTHVPFLRGWSKRFRNRGTGLVIREQEIDDVVPDKSLRHRMKLLSLTMIPWLVKLCPQETLVEESDETLEEEFIQIRSDSRGLRKPLTTTRTLLTKPPSKPLSILDLVVFRLPETMDAKSFQAMTAGKINSRRLYRSPRKLQTQPLSQVSTLHFIEEAPTAEDEVEQEWLFGIKFESDDDSLFPWWIVVQDPGHPSRMLVGCFTNRPVDKDGFLWAETSQEMMKQSGVDDILGFTQTTMIGRKGEDRMEIWSSCDSGDAVHEGALELKSQGRSTTSHLRAMRQTSTEEPQVRPSPPTRPSEVIYKQIVNSLRMYLATVTSPNPVHLRLEMEEEICQVTLLNEWDTIVEEIGIEYTADLISLLRWPMIKGGPLFTDSGEYVTWSVFDDIDFGELDFIRPYITFTAARKTPKELPKRVAQFFDDSEELSMSIAHDTSLCPIALGEGVDHEKCWRVILPSGCPTLVKKQLGGPFTGEEVNGLLSPRRIYTGKLYTFDITPPDLSERDESLVFHEERYIRMFLREFEIHLKPLDPGTFLRVADQKWMVTIAWDGRYFKWQAQSNVSRLFLKGGNHVIKLDNGNSVQEECSRLLNIVTSDIPAGKIVDYSDLEENVLSGLKRLGYSKTPPKCELRFIDQSENICRYGVFLVDGSATEPMEAYCIHAKEPMSEEVLLEEIEASLDTSDYNIVNTGVFMERLAAWVSTNVPSLDEEPGEEGGWKVVLSEDVETGEIRWTAERGILQRVGTIFTDPKVIRRLKEETACKDMRDIFASEVCKELKVISNYDDVLEKQIPEIISNFQKNIVKLGED